MLFLHPVAHAESNSPPQEANQMQTNLMEANKKITTLASDQQKTAKTISGLQTDLNTAHQEIRDLKIEHNQLVAANAGTLRTANGHGRGGR